MPSLRTSLGRSEQAKLRSHGRESLVVAPPVVFLCSELHFRMIPTLFSVFIIYRDSQHLVDVLCLMPWSSGVAIKCSSGMRLRDVKGSVVIVLRTSRNTFRVSRSTTEFPRFSFKLCSLRLRLAACRSRYALSRSFWRRLWIVSDRLLDYLSICLVVPFSSVYSSYRIPLQTRDQRGIS